MGGVKSRRKGEDGKSKREYEYINDRDGRKTHYYGTLHHYA